MIGVDERRMLYTLAKDYYSAEGRIIDGGTFTGSSSLALGIGLKDRNFPKEPVIDAFDTFIIRQPSVALLDSSDPLSQKVKPNDNIRFLYERNVAEVSEYILIHEGDIKRTPWTEGQIEILFCDVSKSLDTNDYIITNWIPALLPETGILIQQDQVQQHHVWVAITMEILADYFEVIDYTVNSSMVYRLKHEIPRRVLDRCLTKNISPEDMEFYYSNFLERFRRFEMGRFTGWQLGMVELGLAMVYGFHIGDFEKAEFTLNEIAKKFANVPDTMARLAEIRRHLEGQTWAPGSRLQERTERSECLDEERRERTARWLDKKLRERTARCERLDEELRERTTQVNQLQIDLKRLEGQLSKEAKNSEQLRQQIDSIHSSICWRVTWPIRWFHKLLIRARDTLPKGQS
jgi:hypothetical protein